MRARKGQNKSLSRFSQSENLPSHAMVIILTTDVIRFFAQTAISAEWVVVEYAYQFLPVTLGYHMPIMLGCVSIITPPRCFKPRNRGRVTRLGLCII